MNNDEIKKAISKLKAEDITVDPFGRVILENPDILGGVAGVPGTLAANYGCCTNGALCKKAALAEIMQDANMVKSIR